MKGKESTSCEIVCVESNQFKRNEIKNKRFRKPKKNRLNCVTIAYSIIFIFSLKENEISRFIMKKKKKNLFDIAIAPKS